MCQPIEFSYHKKRTAPIGAAQPSTMKKSYLSLYDLKTESDKEGLKILKKIDFFLFE